MMNDVQQQTASLAVVCLIRTHHVLALVSVLLVLRQRLLSTVRAALLLLRLLLLLRRFENLQRNYRACITAAAHQTRRSTTSDPKPFQRARKPEFSQHSATSSHPPTTHDQEASVPASMAITKARCPMRYPTQGQATAHPLAYYDHAPGCYHIPLNQFQATQQYIYPSSAAASDSDGYCKQCEQQCCNKLCMHVQPCVQGSGDAACLLCMQGAE
jgi:hypothetical protein